MEKEGLIRAINMLEDRDLEIKEIVTDRHPSIQKHIREKMKQTRHYFDIWHIAKSNVDLAFLNQSI